MDHDNTKESNAKQNNRTNWRPNYPRGHNKRPSRPRQTNDDAGLSNDRPQRRNNGPRTFSQTSVISAGDKGIFVTCDKGREKKSLIELGDLVEDYLETSNLYQPDSKPQASTTEEQLQTAAPTQIEDSSSEDEDIDIESAINSELADLSNNPSTPSRPTQFKPFQLITLDVPCVSFLRFHPLHPSYKAIDPTILVHTICAVAMKTKQIRSRNIRRLSPVLNLQKVLSSGLERCCDLVLPLHFFIPDSEMSDIVDNQSQPQSDSPERKGYTFSIRPTTRNNTSLNRDDVIKYIADRVQLLGGGSKDSRGAHKVDLKHYQKGILVEIYRGWIGMSVVENEMEYEDQSFEYGYEELKRFNLAEIYTEGMRRVEAEGVEMEE